MCAAFFEQRLLDHLNKYLDASELSGGVSITNRSNEWAAVTINGPYARDVLKQCTDAKLDASAFPWMRSQEIDIAGHTCWAFKMSYAGELGWEIHAPRESLLHIYTALDTAGQAYGIADYGSFAMNVMRMEKMFKGAGELTNEVTLPEADVMRFVKMEKEFIGRTATHTSLDNPLRWICAYLSIEADGIVDGHGGEAVLMDDKVVGSTSSVVFSPTCNRILAFAYIQTQAATLNQQLTVIIAGQPRAAVVLDQPIYDPNSSKPRQ